MNVPGSAEHGEIIRVTTSVSGGSEGISLSYTGLLLLRGWHDHCGYCSDSCLVGDEIKTCSNCCYVGCFDTQCSWWWQEFSDTWFGPPVIEFLVTGCGEATLTGSYQGSSHEGPYKTKTYKIRILGGVEAHIASSPSEACVNASARFDASSTCGAADYAWNFGDGKKGSGKTATHKYTSAGTYTVTVTASYNGSSDTASTSITIKDDCATISGVITLAADGTPLPGTTVTAKSGSSTHADLTAGDGFYNIYVPGDEDYTLEAYKSGFDPETKGSVHLDYNDAHTWNAALGFEDVDDTDEEELLGDQPNDVDDPVNPALGNYYFSKSLFSLPGRNGMDFVFRAAYNSKDALYNGPLGYGWTHKYNVVLQKSGNDVTIKFGDGHKEFFIYDDVAGTYEPAKSRIHVTLADRSPSGYTASIGGGITYEFDDQGRLEKIYDRTGSTLTLTHSTQLDRITDSLGNQIDFAYTGGRVTGMSSPLKAGDTLTFQYDGNGDLTALTDPRGNSWQFTYDGSHRLLTERDREGVLEVTNTYDAQGRVVEQEDAMGGQTTYAYSATTVGTRVIITPPSGNWVSHDYDAAFNLLSVTDGEGETAYFGYKKETNGQLAGATDKAGKPIDVEADRWGQVTSFTDNLGIKSEITYNATKQPTSLTDDQGRSMGFGYNGNGDITWIDDVDGGKTQLHWRNSDGTLKHMLDRNGEFWDFYYNAKGLVSGINPTSTLNKTTSFQHDAGGRITDIVFPDSLGSIRYTFDDNGNIVSLLTPLDNQTTFVYDKNDRPVSRTFFPTGATAAYEYDNLGRLTKITDEEGGVSAFTYDPDWNLLSVTDPDGIKVQYEYDDRNQLAKKIENGGVETNYTYDANGHLLSVVNALGNRWSISYDEGGRVAGTVDPLGKTTGIQRNLLDTELLITDKNGRDSVMFRDLKQRPTSIIKPDHTTRHRYYNMSGKIIKATDERGNHWNYTYDRLQRLTSIKDPGGNVCSLGYDARGRLTRISDRNADTTVFDYDLDGRLTKETLPDGSEITYDYQYNPGGTTTITVTEPGGVTVRILDRLNRLTSKTDFHGKTIAYSYTPAGRLASVTYPGGKAVTYEYDAAGRLMHVTDWLSNQTTYHYDSLNRIVSIDYPNGTKKLQQYDARNGVTALAHKQGDNTSIAVYSFTRDPNGRITATTQTAGLAPSVDNFTVTSTYDEVNRTVSTSKDGVSAICRYDGEGNLLSIGSPTEVTRYSYNSSNRLLSVSNGVTTQYAYDANGNRTGKTHDGSETRYLGEMSRTYVSFDGSGTVTRYHIYGHGLVYSLNPSDEMEVYHGDERGSVVAVTGTAGNVIRQYAYDPMGRVLASSGTGSDVFGFLGCHGVMSDENGLVHMGARYYDPKMGRFLNEDPLGADRGANIYAYADGDPVNRIDPTGLDYRIKLTTPGKFCPLENVNYNYKFPKLGEVPIRYFRGKFAPKGGPWIRSGVYDASVTAGRELAAYEGGTAALMEAGGGTLVAETEAGALSMANNSEIAITQWFNATTASCRGGTTAARIGRRLLWAGKGLLRLGEGLLIGYIAEKVATEVGDRIGKAIGSSYMWDPSRNSWITYNQAYQDLFLPGQIKEYSRDDPYLVADKRLREFLKEIGMTYSEYLKIKAEYNGWPTTEFPFCF